MKFDFLGLRTLTIIDWAVKIIDGAAPTRGEAPLDIASLPMDDAPTYDAAEVRPHDRACSSSNRAA